MYTELHTSQTADQVITNQIPEFFLNKNIKQFSLVEEARDGGARIVALKCSILVRSRCEACKPLPFWKALYLLITELDGP